MLFRSSYRPVYAGESHEITDEDLIYEGKYYTSEGVGNCPFCKGAGKVTVEKLGLKDCPDCDGSGDIQQQAPQPESKQIQHNAQQRSEKKDFSKSGKRPDNVDDFDKESSLEHYDKDGTFWFTTQNGRKVGIKKGQTLDQALDDANIPNEEIGRAHV